MAVFTSESEFSENHEISLCLFRNVSNTKELREQLISGKIVAAFIKPCMVVSTCQVLAAANKALQKDLRDKRVTRSLHAELLFCISPSKNISDAFKKFGVGDKDTDILVVEIAEKDKATTDTITQAIQGEQTDIKELKNLTDSTLIKKLYKVTEDELKVGPLEDALLCRIASKEILNL